MGIDFAPARWDRIRKTYQEWWEGKLSRPLIPLTLRNRDPGRPMPTAPLLCQATCADLTVPVAAIVDRLDWELSRQTYLGDAYPFVSMDTFGPGVIAAFLGAKLDNSTGQVWFHAPREIPIADLHLEYDPNNPWLLRIKDLAAAMMNRWQGQVLLGMPDLGGNLDILSSFRPSEQLLLDLYDHPDHVKRVLWEAHELWHRCFAEINQILKPYNPGYSSWCGIYSDRPYYILQCDFCYMIGPDMFRAFVLPELEATIRRLDRSFYHLDGKGQLPHLDMLLSLPRLHGIQWVPGDGALDESHWPEIYERIFAAGKKTQLGGYFAPIYAMLQRTGLGPGVHFCVKTQGESEADIRSWLQRFGV